jgi:hypothetical protein
LGYPARVVEKWNTFAKVRQDLFGGDLLALKSVAPVLVVQATTGANHAHRRRKLAASGYSALWGICRDRVGTLELVESGTRTTAL